MTGVSEFGKPVNWGVLGTGRIADQFISASSTFRTGCVVAVGSRNSERADELAARVDGASGHGSYEDVINNDEVDAVYVATPHPSHLELIVKAASAGKHILCEKPLTMDAAEAREAVAAVRSAGVLLVEAFMYRFQPQTEVLRRVLTDGSIGTPLHIQSSRAFFGGFDPSDRVFDPALGGGAILDVGCYPVSMVRMIAGLLSGNPAIEPRRLSGGGHRGPTGVEEWAVASMEFDDGLTALVRCGVRLQDDGELRVYGEDGYVVVPSPWAPGRDTPSGKLIVHRAGSNAPEELLIPPESLFGLEVDAAAAAFDKGEAAFMTLDDSIANMATLDAWRASVRI